MTQTIREQLQALVDYCDANRSIVEAQWIVGRIESILATEPPAVTVRKGWVVKGRMGVSWHQRKPEFGNRDWFNDEGYVSVDGLYCLADPWPDKPNGGPECCMEVV